MTKLRLIYAVLRGWPTIANCSVQNIEKPSEGYIRLTDAHNLHLINCKFINPNLEPGSEIPVDEATQSDLEAIKKGNS